MVAQSTSLTDGGLTAAWTKFRPHPIQAELWDCRKRFIAVPAGRGSGKTELAKRHLVRSLLVSKPWPDPRYFYGGPTWQQAKRVAWADLLRLIPPAWYDKSDVSVSEMRITTLWGAELWVVGLDKPQRIEGTLWDGCVLDESCDLKPQVFDMNVLPTLTWRNGWCWRIGVPKRQGPSAVEFRDYFEAAQSGKLPDAAGFTWPSSDIVPKQMLDFARTMLDPRDYAEQFDAMFQTAGGGIFHCFDEHLNVRRCPYDPQLPLIIGSDFNVDPMAWAIGQRRGDLMEWFDELWLRNANTPRTLDALWAKYASHKGGFQFFGDATSQARKTSADKTDYAHILNDERFKKAGRIVRYPRQNPRIRDKFSACNAMLKNAKGVRRMFVDPVCVHLLADLRARYYKPGTSDPADAGVAGDVGHITDAMGYATWMLFPVRIELDTVRGAVHIDKGG